MTTPIELFDSSLEWLRQNYLNFPFVVERDIVWTLQQHLSQEIRHQQLAYLVYSDYPMLPGTRRSLCADLVILDPSREVAVAVEFKYEPSRKRADLLKSKFPVVFWGDEGVGKDVKRVHRYIEQGKAMFAVSVFIDEGGAFYHREPHPNSHWVDWGNGIRVLLSRAERQCSSETV